MDAPETLQNAIVYFSDPDRCFQCALNLRWPNGVVSCPRCGSEKHSFIKTRRIWFCSGCKKQFTLKVGTIFEDSPLGMDKWMCAFWMICNCKNGISSYEIARDLKLTQKSAWFVLQRLRSILPTESKQKFGFGGPVEGDETYIGPNPQKMHKDRKAKVQARDGMKGGFVGKTAVQGILDRELRQVRAKVLPNLKRETLQKMILDNVTPFAKVYTDEHLGYDGLSRNYIHKIINHSQEYVSGQVHTQGIENFWSLLKRTLRGTYVAVEPFHLDRYLAEQVFRFNNRTTKDNPLTDGDRFALAVSQISDKRLTFAELTGKVPPSL